VHGEPDLAGKRAAPELPAASSAAPAAATSAGKGENLVFAQEGAQGGDHFGELAGAFQLGEFVPGRANHLAGGGLVGQAGQRPSQEPQGRHRRGRFDPTLGERVSGWWSWSSGTVRGQDAHQLRLQRDRFPVGLEADEHQVCVPADDLTSLVQPGEERPVFLIHRDLLDLTLEGNGGAVGVAQVGKTGAVV
jgi:hypothetical protein